MIFNQENGYQREKKWDDIEHRLDNSITEE